MTFSLSFFKNIYLYTLSLYVYSKCQNLETSSIDIPTFMISISVDSWNGLSFQISILVVSLLLSGKIPKIGGNLQPEVVPNYNIFHLFKRDIMILLMINSAKIEFTLDLCSSQGYTYMMGQRTIKNNFEIYNFFNFWMRKLRSWKFKKWKKHTTYIVWILSFLFLAV